MTYIYRGIEYTHPRQTLTPTSSEVIGMYRGAPCRRQHFQVDIRQSVHKLMYRGVAYTTGAAASTPSPVEAQSSQAPINTQAPAAAQPAFISHRVQRFSALDQVHTASIRKNLEERLATAKAQGDQSLVQLLEVEARELS